MIPYLHSRITPCWHARYGIPSKNNITEIKMFLEYLKRKQSKHRVPQNVHLTTGKHRKNYGLFTGELKKSLGKDLQRLRD